MLYKQHFVRVSYEDIKGLDQFSNTLIRFSKFENRIAYRECGDGLIAQTATAAPQTPKMRLFPGWPRFDCRLGSRDRPHRLIRGYDLNLDAPARNSRLDDKAGWGAYSSVRLHSLPGFEPHRDRCPNVVVRFLRGIGATRTNSSGDMTMSNENGIADASAGGAQPIIREISSADIRDALARGVSDFKVQPTHLFFLCVIYPLAGLFLWRLTAGYEILPYLFPLVSGFALIGPLAATGLYELSRRRERGLDSSWWHVFDVLRSPSLPALVAVGVLLAAIFVAWLIAAQLVYEFAFGNWVPASIGEFANVVFATSSGWALIIVGCAVGFVFAVVVMTISVVSLPMLLDRDVGAVRAVGTSIRAVLANRGPMTIWGIIVAMALVAGSLPFFVGLAIALPILGHSTWHLYRKLVEH